MTRGLRIDWSGKVPLMEMFLSQLFRRGGGKGGEGGMEKTGGCVCVCECVCVCVLVCQGGGLVSCHNAGISVCL